MTAITSLHWACSLIRARMSDLSLITSKFIPPGIEPGTLSVLDSCDNHYTMESTSYTKFRSASYNYT